MRRGMHGVSNVIVALMLIAVAVAAAVLLYVFALGSLAPLQTGGGQQTKQQLVLVTYNWSSVPTLSLTLKNVGTAPVNVGGADVFIEGIKVTNPGNCGTVNPSDSCQMTMTLSSGTYTGGVAYAIKIATPDGAVFSYTAIAGQSG